MTGFDTHLLIKTVEVVFYGVMSDAQMVGDLLVAPTLEYQLDDLQFPGSDPMFPGYCLQLTSIQRQWNRTPVLQQIFPDPDYGKEIHENLAGQDTDHVPRHGQKVRGNEPAE
jgi:hypothetical protein